MKVVAKDCAEKQKVPGSNPGVDIALVAAGGGAMPSSMHYQGTFEQGTAPPNAPMSDGPSISSPKGG